MWTARWINRTARASSEPTVGSGRSRRRRRVSTRGNALRCVTDGAEPGNAHIGRAGADVSVEAADDADELPLDPDVVVILRRGVAGRGREAGVVRLPLEWT